MSHSFNDRLFCRGQLFDSRSSVESERTESVLALIEPDSLLRVVSASSITGVRTGAVDRLAFAVSAAVDLTTVVGVDSSDNSFAPVTFDGCCYLRDVAAPVSPATGISGK